MKKLVGRLIETFTLELGIKIQSASSTTLNREDLRRGVEADECYYVANESAVRHREDIDLARDPPPVLVVEIEVSRRVLGRLPIYAAMGVPEVWCYDGKTLRVSQLGGDGGYHESERSVAFPALPVAAVARFLAEHATTDETELVRAFRSWVRGHFELG